MTSKTAGKTTGATNCEQCEHYVYDDLMDYYVCEVDLDQDEMEAVWLMRRAMASRNTQDVAEEIIDNLAHTKNNSNFVQIIKKVLSKE